MMKIRCADFRCSRWWVSAADIGWVVCQSPVCFSHWSNSVGPSPPLPQPPHLFPPPHPRPHPFKFQECFYELRVGRLLAVFWLHGTCARRCCVTEWDNESQFQNKSLNIGKHFQSFDIEVTSFKNDHHLQVSSMENKLMPRENNAKMHFLKLCLWQIWTTENILVKHCKMICEKHFWLIDFFFSKFQNTFWRFKPSFRVWKICSKIQNKFSVLKIFLSNFG